MAATTAPAQTDRDLASIQEARRLAQRAKQTAPLLAEFSQEQIDRIVDAMAAATRLRAEELARLAVEETSYGVVADKVQKNLFSSERVYEFIRPMRTVGVIRRDEERKVVEIAEPFGVVAAIVPVGVGQVKLSYQKADVDGTVGTDDVSDNDGSQLGLGYVHSLSKRTALYSTYSRISNSGDATFVVPGGNSGITAGGTSWGIEAGIRHNF